MLLFKYLLILTGYGLIVWSLAIVSKNLYKVVQYHRQLRKASPDNQPEKPRLNWTTAKWALPVAWLPILIASGIVVVPSGMGGVRVSQASGTRPGTLYPGVHVVTPLVESVALYDTRDQVLTTASSKDGVEASSKKKDTTGKGEPDEKKPEVFTVQSKEGLSIGMAITVRYRLDPKRLDFIHANLPHPVEKEIVPPAVATVFRELAPNYSVREIFATKREEIRQAAGARLVEKLGPDGIIVKEVMLRDIQLPVEYAKGLEGLLLKEQEDEQMGVETDMKAKQVRIAELEAEAQKIQQVKHAEGDAQVKVLQAKSEADAMQYTLPLKEKQIQQSRLEAEARKEATVKNAEAQAEAKVIDSKAEMQRRTLLADAEAVRIRKIASADSERMKSEADVLKGNPLLINKIIAERLSDKLQIMMVPSDAKIFFNDVMKGGITPQVMDSEEGSQSAQGEEDDPNVDEQEDKTQAPRQIRTHKTISRR
ncbi:MAG TPA: SPFH domain-containing protein [Candidatus Angelobacter sp.]|jgi:regulator of protease activity HflC (stomatin/prohibitin superfamily)|nr:SPFH domain-containing protein [Candidatus Angelobacter sp.]